MSPHQTDALIIGGGPAGLLAAVYLARFRRSVIVLDSGKSRAAIIPRTRNAPGFPDGIEGLALLERLHLQAAEYGAERIAARAERVCRQEDGQFLVETEDARFTTRALLLATGVANVEPPLADHDTAVRQGFLRYCPICDAHEVIGKRVAIIGNSARSAAELSFLRTYSDDVTIVAANEEAECVLTKAGCAPAGVAARIDPGKGVVITLADGRAEHFDTMYSCLGVRPQAALAAQLEVQLAQEGTIETDKHQRTNVEGVFAAGDVVHALDQIAVAFGHAAIAATAMHNLLRQTD